MPVFRLYGDDLWSRNRCDGIRQSFSAAGLGDAVREFTIDEGARSAEIFRGKPGLKSFAAIEKHFLGAVREVNPGADASNLALYDNFKTIVWRQTLETPMRPLFGKALADASITAWVGVTDDVALCALDFLRSRGVRVPRSISVIGFDDRLDSLPAGLTSYNFNAPAVLVAMLDHVLGGRMLKGTRDAEPIEVPGLIVERASTARAPAVIRSPIRPAPM